ncbi:MAG: flagellar export protein FliJ [Syntrophomonadaceae bacterium]|nr:flagellar export protein FliJ [Syntrophomonadaceae bacterium]
MKAFYFRLQKKLDISVQEEKAAKERVQACKAECERIAEELSGVEDRIRQIQESIRVLSGEPGSYHKLLLKKEYLPVLKGNAHAIKENLHNAEKRLEEERKMLMAKMQETQILEKIKEKQWRDYMYQLQAEEQKVIDEAAAGSHLRKSRTIV